MGLFNKTTVEQDLAKVRAKLDAEYNAGLAVLARATSRAHAEVDRVEHEIETLVDHVKGLKDRFPKGG